MSLDFLISLSQLERIANDVRAGERMRPRASLTPRDVTAFHESGHAVMVHHFGLRIACIQVFNIGDEENGFSGFVRHSISEIDSRRECRHRRFKIAMAGVASQILFNVSPNYVLQATEEIREAKELAFDLAVRPDTPSDFFYREMEAILRIIKEYRAAVLALVPVLVAKSEIFGNEATEIIVKAIGAERATEDASLTNCHVLEAHSHLLKD